MSTRICWLLIAIGSAGRPAAAQEQEPLYPVDYPAAERFCPPVRWTFQESSRNWSVVDGRRFRHKPNGGFGLGVIDKQAGKNLRHVGADLGWRRVGEPVFAIADGVVRLSTGPAPPDEAAPTSRPGDLSWGNFIVIEHRLVVEGSDQYVTSVYGHLGADRRVDAGQLVRAGEQIGTIGARHARINGDYTPHLHFGVRRGRIAEVGARLLRLNTPAGPADIKIAALGERTIDLAVPAGFPSRISLTLNGHPFELTVADGKARVSAEVLLRFPPPDFALVGYALEVEPWLDPIRFLRERRADRDPAPFRIAGAPLSR